MPSAKKTKRSFAPIWCNNSSNHNANRFLVSHMTSDVDRQVSGATGINSIIVFIVHSLHREHPLIRSSCLRLAPFFYINLLLFKRFWFESSEINRLDYFYMELTVSYPQLPVTMKIMSIKRLLPFCWRFSADFAPSSVSLQKLWSWCNLTAFYQESLYHRLSLTLETVSKPCKTFSDTLWAISQFS